MAQCLNPYRLKDEDIDVPCGRCYNCLSRRSSGWSFRLMQMEKVSTTAYFVTLTYSQTGVKFTPKKYMTLYKPDVQNFFKKLRFQQFGRTKSTIKYYVCGEYGGLSYRPHYHIILFNADLKYLIGEKDAGHVSRGNIALDGQVPYYCSSWPFGHITVGTVSGASIGYTLKYMHKPFRIPQHGNDDRLPEFSCMSKGLGLNYLTPAMISWHKASLLDRMYLNVDDKKISMPRYYKDKMYTDEERQEILISYLKKPRQEVTLSRHDAKRMSDLKLKQSSTKNRKL